MFLGEFVKRVRESRAEKAKEAGTYDEKFGTVVIKGEDFDRIANSFLVVIPTVSGYTVSIDRRSAGSAPSPSRSCTRSRGRAERKATRVRMRSRSPTASRISASVACSPR